MSLYDDFRNNPFINSIAALEKWTVSTKDKVPIDIKLFMYQGRICGATHNDELSLASLDQVHQAIKEAVNHTFYLDALYDNFVVLDIEPSCSDDMKTKFLAMPCLYCERSMSGKGLHMIFKLPGDILDKYPDAREKLVLKSKNKDFEILLNHYITFTGNQVPAIIGQDDTLFREFFESMAQEQTSVIKAKVDIQILNEDEKPPHSDIIISTLLSHANEYKKRLEDFHGDHSNYEFAHITFLHYRLVKMLNISSLKSHAYTDSEKAWILYRVATEYFPYRPKHDEMRKNMPWLYYLASEVIASFNAFQAAKEKKT